MNWNLWFKDNRSFLLTLLCIVGSLTLAFVKDLDVTMLLPALLGIYVTKRATEKVSAHVNARKDVDADLSDIIKTLDNQGPK